MSSATKILILANTAVFLLVFSMPQGLMKNVFGFLSFSSERPFELWRWFASLFLHASASHLFFNMLGLYVFGSILEMEAGTKRFLAIYFSSGLVGNLAFAITTPGMAVGASGAVFGILGAAMFIRPSEIVNLYIFPLPLSIIAVLFIISESFVLYFHPAEFANIATVAHVAGIIAGSAMAFYYYPKRAAKSLPLLVLTGALTIFLFPFLALITAAGGFVWKIIDFVTGIALYTLAGILSFIWA